MVKYNQVIILYIPHRDKHQLYTSEKLAHQCSPESDKSGTEQYLLVLKKIKKKKVTRLFYICLTFTYETYKSKNII